MESSGADTRTTSTQLLSLNDESIKRLMAEKPQIENLFAFSEIGQKLKDNAEAMLEEAFRDYYIIIDGYYADFGVKEENVKKFSPYVRKLTIMETGAENGKKVATFIESNFRHIESIELKFVSITRHFKNIFKNVDTITFNTCQNYTDFCYYDHCLRYCERLRCLRFLHFGTAEKDADKFNAIMRQKYSGLETVQFDFRLTPNMLKYWERFIQHNPSIKSLSIRFLNKESERFFFRVMKPVVTNALNIRRLFLHIDFDARHTDVFNFNFEIVHEQLAILDRQNRLEYLGIYVEYSKLRNLNLCASLKCLKLLKISHTDPCNILREISNYSTNVQILALDSFNSTCRLGDHQTLDKTWNYNFANLQELRFWKVANAYFLIPLFICRSPNLTKIVARDCKIVLEKFVKLSMNKFNDDRMKVRSDATLIIYTDQPNIESNYEFDLVKLKRIDFKETPFTESNPFEVYTEDKIGSAVFHSINEDEVRV